ncbi:hypothetical protein GW17_00010406 [Ensete ventricosum]|nr:hypothetical protein GW17_00010406 [Ensete ventricosum]
MTDLISSFLQLVPREVGQSYIISIGTTLIATAHALWLVIRIRPQVIICNDPGTCIPLCASGFPFKVCITHVTYIQYSADYSHLE